MESKFVKFSYRRLLDSEYSDGPMRTFPWPCYRPHSIGVASSAQGFQGVDGILGYIFSSFHRAKFNQVHSIGPVDLTQGMLRILASSST